LKLYKTNNQQVDHSIPNTVPVELYPPLTDLKINPEYILRGMGMTRIDADDYLLSLIEELISKCVLLAEPKATFILFNSISFNLEKQKILIADETFNTGKIVLNSLKKSNSIAIFTATCGDKIETWSKELMKKNFPLEALIVDLIGSEFVEAIVEYLHQFLEIKAKESGNKVSNRFSPGYCNWPVSDQKNLFTLLQGNNCGIILTESSLMTPIKSVSGFIGIGPTLKKADYSCQVCSDLNCIMRLHIKD
jgi:hypothetical protein